MLKLFYEVLKLCCHVASGKGETLMLLGGVKETFKGQLILLPFHGICITDQLNCYVHVIFSIGISETLC